MGELCDRFKLCSKAAPDCQTGQNKGRHSKQEGSFLLVLLVSNIKKDYRVELLSSLYCGKTLKQVKLMKYKNLQGKSPR